MELKTARLTILIDPAKKQAFEELCRTQDMTPSQVVRRLIRDFMEDEDAPAAAARRPVPRKAAAAVKKSPAKKAPARKR
jgi:predicted transcriptional regulator